MNVIRLGMVTAAYARALSQAMRRFNSLASSHVALWASRAASMTAVGNIGFPAVCQPILSIIGKQGSGLAPSDGPRPSQS